MATNHALPRTRLETGDDSQSYTRFGHIALALVLALVLGFSAIDIQRQRAADLSVSDGASEQERLLDGRGKWGGYL